LRPSAAWPSNSPPVPEGWCELRRGAARDHASWDAAGRRPPRPHSTLTLAIHPAARDPCRRDWHAILLGPRLPTGPAEPQAARSENRPGLDGESPQTHVPAYGLSMERKSTLSPRPDAHSPTAGGSGAPARQAALSRAVFTSSDGGYRGWRAAASCSSCRRGRLRFPRRRRRGFGSRKAIYLGSGRGAPGRASW